LSILAALGSALFIGGADFVGGWAARSANNLPVTLRINAVALVVVAIAYAIVQPRISTGDALGAVAGGCVSAVSINLIYAAFAAGAMSLTAPLIACGTAVVPTIAATVAGQPPDAVQGAGIALTLVGVVAITWAPQASPVRFALSRRALWLSALASLTGGLGVAILLLSAKGGPGVALGVSATSRVASLSVCALFVALSGRGAGLPGGLGPRILVAGLLEAAGVSLFLLASSLGSTAVAAVILSLYAIVTVLLAQTLLRERVSSRQGWGIAVAAVGVAILSAG
jgi:drug/metabolite transporter (DMT)-like permease